jgi:hypothetical protein
MWKYLILAGLVLITGCQTLEKTNLPVTIVIKGIEFLFSESLPEEITVSATGTGSTREEALQNALKEAVQKGVGILVISDLRIKDQKIISDQLLNYSSGFIKDYKTEECLNNKKITCKIQAKVAPWNLLRNQFNLNDKQNINGEQLVTQHNSTKDVIAQQKKLLIYYKEKISEEGYKFEVKDVNSIPSYSNLIPIEITYRLIPNFDLRKEIFSFLKLVEVNPENKLSPEIEKKIITIGTDSSYLFKKNLRVIYWDEEMLAAFNELMSKNIEIYLVELGMCIKENNLNLLTFDEVTGKVSGNYFPNDLKNLKNISTRNICLQRVKI